MSAGVFSGGVQAAGSSWTNESAGMSASPPLPRTLNARRRKPVETPSVPLKRTCRQFSPDFTRPSANGTVSSRVASGPPMPPYSEPGSATFAVVFESATQGPSFRRTLPLPAKLRPCVRSQSRAPFWASAASGTMNVASVDAPVEPINSSGRRTGPESAAALPAVRPDTTTTVAAAARHWTANGAGSRLTRKRPPSPRETHLIYDFLPLRSHNERIISKDDVGTHRAIKNPPFDHPEYRMDELIRLSRCRLQP